MYNQEREAVREAVRLSEDAKASSEYEISNAAVAWIFHKLELVEPRYRRSVAEFRFYRRAEHLYSLIGISDANERETFVPFPMLSSRANALLLEADVIVPIHLPQKMGADGDTITRLWARLQELVVNPSHLAWAVTQWLTADTAEKTLDAIDMHLGIPTLEDSDAVLKRITQEEVNNA